MDVFAQVLAAGRPALRRAATDAALQLGVFDALRTPCDLESLASELGLRHARRLRPLIDLLVHESFVARDAGLLCVATLPAQGGEPMGSGLGWDGLATAIRTDRPLSVAASTAAHHEHLLAVGEPVAAALFDALPELDGTLLDVGSGAGAYSRAFLARGAENRTILVDAPEILRQARDALGAWPGRAAFVEGDFLRLASDDVPRSVDAALLANVLHLHGAEVCAALVARCAAALRPGGKLVVKDLAMDEDRGGPALGLYFAVNMAVYTERGDVHRKSEIVGWMASAGLETEEVDFAKDTHVICGRRGDA